MDAGKSVTGQSRDATTDNAASLTDVVPQFDATTPSDEGMLIPGNSKLRI